MSTIPPGHTTPTPPGKEKISLHKMLGSQRCYLVIDYSMTNQDRFGFSLEDKWKEGRSNEEPAKESRVR